MNIIVLDTYAWDTRTLWIGRAIKMTCFTGVYFFFLGGKISVIYKFFIYEKGKIDYQK